MACTHSLLWFALVAAILEVSYWWQHYCRAAPVVTIQHTGYWSYHIIVKNCYTSHIHCSSQNEADLYNWLEEVMQFWPEKKNYWIIPSHILLHHIGCWTCMLAC